MSPKAKDSRPQLEVLQTRSRIGDLLRDFREQAQLSPQAAAEMMSISAKDLLDAESGAIEIPLQQIFAAANVYNIDPSAILDLISEIDLAEASSDEEIERIAKLKI